MKTTMLSVIGCALLAAGALEQARAQTTNTNVTVNVNIALSGVVASNEDRSMPVHITTKDVINAIGGSTSNSFSSKAKLIAVENGGGNPTFFIRDGTADTQVSDSMLSVAPAPNSNSVKNERTATSGAISGTETSIQVFALTTDSLSFTVQGFTTASVS